MILQEIRQGYFSRVVWVKLVELITDLQYIIFPNLSHLLELEDNIF